MLKLIIKVKITEQMLAKISFLLNPVLEKELNDSESSDEDLEMKPSMGRLDLESSKLLLLKKIQQEMQRTTEEEAETAKQLSYISKPLKEAMHAKALGEKYKMPSPLGKHRLAPRTPKLLNSPTMSSECSMKDTSLNIEDRIEAFKAMLQEEMMEGKGKGKGPEKKAPKSENLQFLLPTPPREHQMEKELQDYLTSTRNNCKHVPASETPPTRFSRGLPVHESVPIGTRLMKVPEEQESIQKIYKEPRREKRPEPGIRISTLGSSSYNKGLQINPKSLQFDGRGGWLAFRKKFELCASVNHWTDDESYHFLCWSLIGKAAEYHAMVTEIRDYTYLEMMKKLEDRYGAKELAETSRAQLMQSAQRSDESLEDWSDRVLTLATKAYRDLNEAYLDREAISQLCQGCLDKEAGKHALTQRPKTMDEALDKIKYYQYISQSMDGRRVRKNKHEEQVMAVSASQEKRGEMNLESLVSIVEKLQKSVDELTQRRAEGGPACGSRR